MKLAARCMTMMAVAFVILPAVRADDETSLNAKKDESTASIAAPSVPASAQPIAAKMLPARSSTGQPSQSGAGAQAAGGEPRADTPSGSRVVLGIFLLASHAHGLLATVWATCMAAATSVAYNFNRYLGLVADFGGYDNSRLTLLSPTGSETENSN